MATTIGYVMERWYSVEEVQKVVDEYKKITEEKKLDLSDPRLSPIKSYIDEHDGLTEGYWYYCLSFRRYSDAKAKTQEYERSTRNSINKYVYRIVKAEIYDTINVHVNYKIIPW